MSTETSSLVFTHKDIIEALHAAVSLQSFDGIAKYVAQLRESTDAINARISELKVRWWENTAEVAALESVLP